MRQMSDGINYEQRDIVLLPFPYSDLAGAKQRPALIISNQRLNRTEDRICCLITSNAPIDGLILANADFVRGSLPFQSWVKPQRLFTVNRRIIRKKLCSVTPSFHGKVLRALEKYTETEI